MAKENRTRYAILGMLDWQPMSGYDIKKMADGSLAHFWKEDYGHIYPTLKALMAEGLVERRIETSPGKPPRHINSITPAGRRELLRWLAESPNRPNLRIELLLKIFYGRHLGPEGLIPMLREEIASCEAALAELAACGATLAGLVASQAGQPDGAPADQSEGGDGDPAAFYQLLSLRYGQRYYRAVADWCAESIIELEAWRKAGAGRDLPRKENP